MIVFTKRTLQLPGLKILWKKKYFLFISTSYSVFVRYGLFSFVDGRCTTTDDEHCFHSFLKPKVQNWKRRKHRVTAWRDVREFRLKWSRPSWKILFPVPRCRTFFRATSERGSTDTRYARLSIRRDHANRGEKRLRRMWRARGRIRCIVCRVPFTAYGYAAAPQLQR